MPWIPRGLREGIVTSRYPRRPDSYGEDFHGTMVILPSVVDESRLAAVMDVCPTAAISTKEGQPRLDRGRCILCGRCAEQLPQIFRFDPNFETSRIHREALVIPEREDEDGALQRTRADIGRRVRALRRSVHIRHVDAGSDGAEEWEVAALTNPVYDVQRLGIYFTASPRHADVLLATGVGAAGMIEPLRDTYNAMPEPKIVIAAGVDAISGGLFGHGYAAGGGLTDSVPVDVFVPGSPPSPFGLLHAILVAVGRLPGGGDRTRRRFRIRDAGDLGAAGGATHHERADREPAFAEDPSPGATS